MPRRDYEKRLVRSTPVKKPGRMRDTSGFHALPRVSATEMIRVLACSPLLGAALSPDILSSLLDFLCFVDVSAAFENSLR